MQRLFKQRWKSAQTQTSHVLFLILGLQENMQCRVGVLFLSGVLVFCIFVFALEKKMKILVKGNIFIVWDWKTELSLMRGDSNGVRLYEGLLGIPPDLEPSPSALFPAAVWNFVSSLFSFSLNYLHWIIDVHLLQQQQMARTRTRSSSTAGEKEFWIENKSLQTVTNNHFAENTHENLN